MEGSQAVAEAVALCRPEVICAYPISPQTHIVEHCGLLVRRGKVGNCEYINVESEFAALSVAIGASAAGARSYTATASQGLLYMAEAIYNAAGLGLPIVMTVANRAIGAPINIWNDHTDSMAMRDAGWIQLFAETNQEALDLHIQAFKIAEWLSCPVMVCMDGFILTHAYERVNLPDQATVDEFLPPYRPRQVLDPANPYSIGAMVGPEAFMEVRYLAHDKQIQALDVVPGVSAEFFTLFGRRSGGLAHRGVRKLLDIAMAVVSQPRILLLDEPTSGVSVKEKFALMDIVMKALSEDKVTVLFIEHDMEIVERYVTRVIAFYEGEIICDESPAEALADPKVQEYVIGVRASDAGNGA